MKFKFTDWNATTNPWPDQLSEKLWKNVQIASLVLIWAGVVLNILSYWVIEDSVSTEMLGSVLLALGILVVIAGMKPEDEYDKIFKWGFVTVIIISLLAMFGMCIYKLIIFL